MPYIVNPVAGQPNAWDYLGQGSGKLTQLILNAILAGQIGQKPTTPTPGNPGQLQFPSGASTRTSPSELAQIQAMGGVPTTTGQSVPFSMTPQPGQVGATFQPPTRWGLQPDLARQLQQSQIQASNALTQQRNAASDPNSPLGKFLTAQAMNQTNSQTTQPTSSTPSEDASSNDALAKYLAKKALEGDEEADLMLQQMGY